MTPGLEFRTLVPTSMLFVQCYASFPYRPGNILVFSYDSFLFIQQSFTEGAILSSRPLWMNVKKRFLDFKENFQ